MNQALETIEYDDSIVRKFLLATLGWAFVAFLLGVVVALQLAHHRFNLGLEWLTFGRLRPLHTNAAIFAFGGNAIFAGIYYSSQRLLKTRMASDFLSGIHFWGWQLIIVAAAVSLPLGFTVGKEYAELEWPIAQAVNVIWVVFGVNFFATIARRRERHLYVAIWFYIATIVAVALLHVLNTINLPVSFTKSYPIYAGVQDAMVQWWYGHNAVAFFLTTPFLGLMYYFLPKASGRPIFSYRLSLVHFWSLVFMYIWAGPHHLLYTALPDWAQTLGMVFSLMLWAPSWGGMLNGLYTLRGSWDRVRKDPILKMFVAGLTFYGMSTFEGPLLSIKSVSALAHYSDWIIGHVHGGTLGWNGFITFAMAYWLVPRLWNTTLYSVRLANLHFWFGTVGTMLYVVSMWAAGITQGLMLRAVDGSGRLLYPDFVETTLKILPLYWVRAGAGLCFLVGYTLMLYNLWKTIRAAKGVVVTQVQVPRLEPVALTPAGLSSLGNQPHRVLEALPSVFAVLTFVGLLVGTVIELLPTFLSHEFAPVRAELKPYSALELAGRDIYVREGCYTCHSQMIRPLVHETLRYGAPSKIEESVHDRPFQWGSRRTGPDLARVGGKYPDLWHYRHMMDPREVNPGSVMPAYTWLFRDKIAFSQLPRKLKVLQTLGDGYSDGEIAGAADQAREEAQAIAAGLEKQGVPAGMADREIIAMIAYLQRLGRDARLSGGGR
jgi:cytochrome c oxidase cbb3-type subunit I/II